MSPWTLKSQLPAVQAWGRLPSDWKSLVNKALEDATASGIPGLQGATLGCMWEALWHVGWLGRKRADIQI